MLVTFSSQHITNLLCDWRIEEYIKYLQIFVIVNYCLTNKIRGINSQRDMYSDVQFSMLEWVVKI
jgi:hypothetical protein